MNTNLFVTFLILLQLSFHKSQLQIIVVSYRLKIMTMMMENILQMRLIKWKITKSYNYNFTKKMTMKWFVLVSVNIHYVSLTH